jgi:hypothetical protein
MLREAIQQEAEDYLHSRCALVDENVATDYSQRIPPELEVVTRNEPVSVCQPRVRDMRSVTEREVFDPFDLSKHLRKSKSIEEPAPSFLP